MAKAHVSLLLLSVLVLQCMECRIIKLTLPPCFGGGCCSDCQLMLPCAPRIMKTSVFCPSRTTCISCPQCEVIKHPAPCAVHHNNHNQEPFFCQTNKGCCGFCNKPLCCQGLSMPMEEPCWL